jgi:hypothetical protein
MGVTICSKNKSIDLGYFGFNFLRTKVADLAGEDIGEHYRKLNTAPYFGEEKRERFFEEYNKKTNELDEKYKGEMNCVLHFIYASDCDAEMGPDVCEKIYETIKDYDDDVLYGYSGRLDCAKFKDFKEIVRDCIENNCSMTWS